MALSNGILRGEVATLYWTREGVIDLRLLGRGTLGLTLFRGVCWGVILVFWLDTRRKLTC
jgi:hypothetical protein